MVSWLKRFHRLFLSPYDGFSFSVRSRVSTFLVLIYLLVPVVTSALMLSVVSRGDIQNVFIEGIFLTFVGLAFYLLKAGRRKVAAALFTSGLAGVTLLAHFSVVNWGLVRVEMLLVERLAFLGTFNLVAIILVTESLGNLVAIAGVFFATGVIQCWFLQWPVMPPEKMVPFFTAAVRFAVLFPGVTFLLALVQQSTNRAVFLADQNREELEQEVSDRTVALRAAVDNLQSVQKHLVEGEKFQALGRMAASVAHEVNTPLGAIVSSASAVQSNLEYLFQNLSPLVRTFSDTEAGMFRSLLKARHDHVLDPDSGLPRPHKKELTAGLAQAGISHPRELADSLVSLGIISLDVTWVPLLTRPDNREILLMAEKIVEVLQATAIIELAAGKATDFVKGLQRFINRETYPREPEPVDLVESLETILLLFHHQMKNRIRIVRNIDTRPVVLGHPDQILEIWNNLVQNAIHAMEGDGDLSITVRSQASQVLVAIGDTGPGIPPDLQEKIFEPFFSPTEDRTGMGLGLEIVKNLLRSNNATMNFDSEPGKTEFRVYFPKSIQVT